MGAEPRFQEMHYWFPVPDMLRSGCLDFIDWLNEHADEIEAQDVGVSFEMLCRMDELEGDIRAAVYSGGIDEYAAAWLSGYYTRGGILSRADSSSEEGSDVDDKENE